MVVECSMLNVTSYRVKAKTVSKYFISLFKIPFFGFVNKLIIVVISPVF